MTAGHLLAVAEPVVTTVREVYVIAPDVIGPLFAAVALIAVVSLLAIVAAWRS